MKKRVIKILLVMMIFCIALGMCSLVACANNSVSVKVDGVEKQLKTKAVINQEGQVLVSVDDLPDLLGATYEYEQENNSIHVAVDNDFIDYVIGETSIKANRLKFTLDNPINAVDGKVMVPLEFFGKYLGYDVEWNKDEKIINLDKQNLISTLPQTEQEQAIIARANQLTSFTFTPLKDMPGQFNSSTEDDAFFKAGKEYKGFPYSSVQNTDKFLCENVSFETFLSALANPDSVLYTKRNKVKGSSTYYGIVCNGLVRYSLGIPQRYMTDFWLETPGMSVVAEKGQWTPEDIKLCDILHVYNDGSNHVIIITDILRDENGKIVKIELSEATRPTCIRRAIYTEDLMEKYWKYRLCRYEYIDSVPLFDETQENAVFKSGIDKKQPMIAVDYGNKSNYYANAKTVISVFAQGQNTVQILKDGTLIEEIETNDYKKINRYFEPGYYVVKLANTEHFTEFCVVKPIITHTFNDGVVTINASTADEESQILHMEFRREGDYAAVISQMVQLTKEERESGIIVKEVPEDAYYYKISFKNKYGIWTHSMIYCRN